MNGSRFYPINEPYGYCLLPLDKQNRDQTSSETYGDGIHFKDCVPQLIKSPEVIGPQNTSSVNNLDQYFFNQNTHLPSGVSNNRGGKQNYYSSSPLPSYYETPALADSQPVRPTETRVNSYIKLASNSLHISPDTVMSLFFSDDNVNHLRESVVDKVKQVTAKSGVAGDNEGVTIKKPNMDDMFYYMVNIYQNYKVYNGSICFANIKKPSDVKAELIKLNTNLLQDYVSKMISQINMYIYYYKDASQLPQQLSQPLLTSMKGAKTLEYNTGFTSGNSIGVASFNQVGNIM
jgi:hypothetical protein